MSATDDVPPEELEAAIAENPEAVAAFVRRLGAVNELVDVLAAGETADLAAAVGENSTELQETVELFADLQRIGRLAGRLADGVPRDRLHSPPTPESGLVTIDVAEPETTVERLANEGIVVRALPSPSAIRASVHAVNTASEVDRLLDALEPAW